MTRYIIFLSFIFLFFKNNFAVDTNQPGVPRMRDNAFINKQESIRHTTNGLRPNGQKGVRRLVPQEYATIQAAIDSSVHGDTVLVSDGTYIENIRFQGKAITVASLFIIDGDTTHISETIIDGSNSTNVDSASVVYFINGEDTSSVLTGFTITGGKGTILAEQEVQWRAGGGIFCGNNVGAKIINNHITGNTISDQYSTGAGVSFMGNGYFILENNKIYDNHLISSADWAYGGGVEFFSAGGYARIAGNVFENNSVTAKTYAVSGALDIEGNDEFVGGIISNNIFRGNIVNATNNNGVGGAMYCYRTSDLHIIDNQFENNQANSKNGWAEGAGLLLDDRNYELFVMLSGTGFKTISGNRFINNRSKSNFGNGTGGGIELFHTRALVNSNFIFQNSAQGGTSQGGGIRILSSEYRVENNILTENTSSRGGAIYVTNEPQSGKDKTIINNTIVNNKATITGGGIAASATKVILVNTILWGNQGGGSPQLYGGTYRVRHCNIEGKVANGIGNISSDPLFADTLFYLSDNSPCIGRGVTSGVIEGISFTAPTTDFYGMPRPIPENSNPDIGALENPLGIQSDYIIVPDHYATIQEGINAAENGNVLLVRDGTYQENINFKGKAITLASFYFLDIDTSHISETIIDGSNPSNPDSGSVVTLNSGEDTTSVLMGFTITGGSGTLSSYTWDNNVVPVKTGGGVLCYISGARIEHNIIRDNSINSNDEAGGGGISCLQEDATVFLILNNNQIINNHVMGSNAGGAGLDLSCNATITNNVISYNNATSTDGWVVGAIIDWSQSKFVDVKIINNTITHNKSNAASYGIGGGIDLEEKVNSTVKENNISFNELNGTTGSWGGGIYIVYGSGKNTISQNKITNNISSHNGGGIALFENTSSTSIVNNIISGNSTSNGGGIRSKDSKTEIINNTIVKNHASNTGGGIRATEQKPIIFNTIVWGNTATSSGTQLSGSFDIAYSNIEGQVFNGENHNISHNPAFADTLFHLSDSSACVGNGADSVTINGMTYFAPETDFEGNERPHWREKRVDIGAYESPYSRPTGIKQKHNLSPYSFKLKQNYPNPFNPETTIEFSIPKNEYVTLKAYNLLGQEVLVPVAKKLKAGNHSIHFDASDLPSGIYIYSLKASSGFSQSKKMIVLK